MLVISSAYSRIIEHFPFGGGGYVVQNMLACRNERESRMAALFFNIAHYGIVGDLNQVIPMLMKAYRSK